MLHSLTRTVFDSFLQPRFKNRGNKRKYYVVNCTVYLNISLFAVAGSDSATLPVKKLRLQKRLLEDSGWIKAKVTGTTGSLGIRQLYVHSEKDPDPSSQNAPKSKSKRKKSNNYPVIFTIQIQNLFKQIQYKYCKNYKTNLTSKLKLLIWIWIQIRIWIQICIDADAYPGSGSALQPMWIHIIAVSLGLSKAVILPLGRSRNKNICFDKNNFPANQGSGFGSAFIFSSGSGSRREIF